MALLVIVIGAILYRPPRRSQQQVPAVKQEADTVWQPQSITAEPELKAEPALKVTRVPPLPQEELKFRSLPPRDQDDAPTFAPLPKLQDAEPADQNDIQIRQLPTLPPAGNDVASP